MKWIQHLLMAMVSLAALFGHLHNATGKDNVMNRISLPEPRTRGTVSVEEAIQRRRSQRNFKNRSLTKEQLSQLAWCAQGITDADGHKRATPSAGATYPLDLYVVVGEKTCGDIPAGVYRYLPEDHALKIHLTGDRRQALAAVALGQDFVMHAPLVMVLAADYSRTTGRYGKRGIRYVDMEAGHAGENVHLQAESLGLGSCMVGAFDDSAVSAALHLPAEYKPLYIMPVGHPK
ncbi:MAG: SagB/ThcOx family dehydrogenase [Kiritimatiellia bacterium]|nr:SagB/ThcOx family dehydrogenase [Kiritimatiellia bacterium]